MTKIANIKAREVLDSRGNPTVELTSKTAPSEPPVHLPVLLPAPARHWSCVMVMLLVTWVCPEGS